MLEKLVLSHLNTDDATKDLQQGEYISQYNLLPFSDNSTGVRRRNVRGTELLGTFPVSADAINIGARYFKALNKSYFAFSDKTDGDCIIEFDFNTNQMSTVFKNAGLNFDPRYTVELRPVTGLSGNLLYFNDGLPDHARKINIDRAKAGLYDGANFSDLAIAQIRKQPTFEILCQRGTDLSSHRLVLNPPIRRIPFQFSLRYVYLDGEITVLGPISRVIPASQYKSLNADYNVIYLNIEIDLNLKPFIDRAELLVRQGNTGLWQIYDKLPMSMFTGDGLSYEFFNDKSGPTLSDLESIPLYESFPRATSSMELHQDRLFEVDSTSDYDSEESGWDGSVTLSTINFAGVRNVVDADVYPELEQGTGLGFLGISKYAASLVFLDKFGKTGPVASKKNMVFSTQGNLNTFRVDTLPPGIPTAVMNATQDLIQATVNLTGIPPSWAHYAKPVRTANLNFDWWYANKFAIKFPVSDDVTSETQATIDASQYYIEDGYLYYKNNNNAGTPFAVLGGLIDIIIPADFPFATDDTMLISLTFDYPIGSAMDGSTGTINFETSVIRIIGDKVRIRASELTKINQFAFLLNDLLRVLPDVTYFSQFTGLFLFSAEDTAVNNVFSRLHLTFKHPYTPAGDLLFQECGDTILINNPGTAQRAFSKTSFKIPGDTYISPYKFFESQSLSALNVPPTTWSGTTEYPHQDGPYSYQGVSYNAMSPLTNSEKNLFKTGIATDQGKTNIIIDRPMVNHFGNIVRWSDAFSSNSNINGFGVMQSGNKYPVPIERGDIVKLVSTSENILLAIHARAMTALSVNVRITKSREDDSVVTSDDVVGDNRPVAGDYGTINPESVVCVDGYRVYGFDLNTGEPWRKSLDGLTTLATTYKTKKWFKYKSDVLKAAKVIDPTIDIKIIGGFDPFLSIFYLTFQEVTYMDYPVQITIPAETVAFSELQKGWIGYFDFIPEWFTYNGNNLLMVKDQKLWIHDKDAQNCNTFFGTAYDSKITLVCNMQSDMDKIWENIGLSTNGDWDVTSIITPDGRQTDMIASTFVTRDDVKYSEVLRDTTTPPSLLPPGKSARLHGQLMISQVVSITLRNSEKKEITLDAVYIGFSPVQGHLMSLKK